MTIQADLITRCRSGAQVASLRTLMSLASDDELIAGQCDRSLWRELAARWYRVAPTLRTQDQARQHYDHVAEALSLPRGDGR